MKKLLLGLFALICCMVANAKTVYELGEELTLGKVKDGNTLFALVRASDKQVLVYGSNGNRGFMKDVGDSGLMELAPFFKLISIAGNEEYAEKLGEARKATEKAFDGDESNDALFMFRAYKNAEQNFTSWKNDGYVSHCGWCVNSNSLNLDANKFGDDKLYGAIWKVVAVDGGYTIQSQSYENKGYLNGEGGPGESAATWKFYSLKTKEVADDVPPVYTFPEGAVDLTKDMFKHWKSPDADAEVEGNANCAYEIGKSTGMPYGDSNVGYLNYANLSDYSKLIILVKKDGGAPRLCINRLTDGGNVEFDLDILDANKKEKTKLYCTTETCDDGNVVYTYDIAKITTEAGFAHLHAIKGASWQSVNVYDMKLVPAEKVTIPAITVTSVNKFGTYISPVAAKLPEGLNAYTCESVKDDAIVLVEAESIEANKAYVVYNSTDKDVTLEEVKANKPAEEQYTTGLLTGTLKNVESPKGSYILQNQNGNVGFYLCKDAMHVYAGHCYLTLPAGKAKSLSFIFSDGTTGVPSLDASEAGAAADGKIYDINGIERARLEKGVNIINGVKVIVK